MSFRLNIAAVLAVALTPFAGLSEETISVTDAFFRAAPGPSPTGAAFMTLTNGGTTDDRLIGAESDLAAKVELHTHEAGADGVMKMRPIEGGIPLPAGESHELARGADHVMFMGIGEKPAEGEMVTLTLIFEQAGEITIQVPVGEAAMGHGMGHNHGADHGDHGEGHMKDHSN